jgi:hypothetical protein
MATKIVDWTAGIPPMDVTAKFRDLLRDWNKAGQLELVGREVQTPNQVLDAASRDTFSGGGLVGLAGKVLGINVGPKRGLDFDIRGGMRVAHVHLDGNIYLLNDEQWAQVSGKVVQDFQMRLNAVKNVPLSLEQVTAIGAASNALGG